MKLIREHINEKFSRDSDPINDLNIGAVHYFKNFLTLFPKEDKDYLFYSFTIFNGNIYFWGYVSSIRERLKNEHDKKRYLLNYFKNIINNLGLNSLLYDCKLYFFPGIPMDEILEGYLIICKMNNVIKDIFPNGNYRKLNYDDTDNFHFFEKESLGFKRKVNLYTMSTPLTEKFEEESDPIYNLGIGSEQDIINKCKQLLLINHSDISQKNKINDVFMLGNKLSIKLPKDSNLRNYVYNLIFQVKLNEYLRIPAFESTFLESDFFIFTFKSKIKLRFDPPKRVIIP